MMKDKYNTKPAAYSIIISPIFRFFNYLLQIIDHIKLLPSTKTYLFYFKNWIFLPFFFNQYFFNNQYFVKNAVI